jgi:hypothetical protein
MEYGMSVSQNFPNLSPSLNLDFAQVKKLDPRITFSRPTSAVVYDGRTVSKAEENLLLYSQKFDNAVWSKSAGATVTANTTTAPDGTVTADTLVCSTGSDWIRQNVSIATALRYTHSIYVQPNASTTFTLSEAGATASSANFTLSGAGSVSVSDNGGSPTATITDAGSGWYRCTFSWTNNAGLSTLFIHNYSPSAFIWGAQVEQRSAVSSYTPTTTQPITNYQPTLLTASANVARFDHDPITNESLGLLIEEQRTNLATYSQDFTNAVWSIRQLIKQPNIAIGVDGTLTAAKIIPDTTNNFHDLRNTTSIAKQSISIYAKAAGYNFISVRHDGSPAGLLMNFDLVNGTFGSLPSGVASASMENVGNGWWRCSVNYTTITVAAGTSFVVSQSLTDTGSTTYTGDGYSGIYIWGAQLEAGAFPTSYIPTVASQVTRSVDSASMTGANFSSWYRADEGTVYTDYSAYTGVLGVLINFRNSAAIFNNTHELFVRSSGTSYLVKNNNVYQVTMGTATIAGKASFAYKVNDFVVYNGDTIAVDTVGILPVGQDQLFIGTNGGNVYSGTIKKISYFPARLSNEELQEMTS